MMKKARKTMMTRKKTICRLVDVLDEAVQDPKEMSLRVNGMTQEEEQEEEDEKRRRAERRSIN